MSTYSAENLVVPKAPGKSWTVDSDDISLLYPYQVGVMKLPEFWSEDNPDCFPPILFEMDRWGNANTLDIVSLSEVLRWLRKKSDPLTMSYIRSTEGGYVQSYGDIPRKLTRICKFLNGIPVEGKRTYPYEFVFLFNRGPVESIVLRRATDTLFHVEIFS